jgi:hypothetical protein
VPTPDNAEQGPLGLPCQKVGSIVQRDVCAFGANPRAAGRTVALVGDSHAGMWMRALDHAARALKWAGLRVGRSSCPLSKARRDLVEPDRSHCARWKRSVFAWFKRHREVDTVVVSQLSGGSGVVPTGGRSEVETSVAGYLAAWRALPATVERIVVIRDSPKAEPWTLGCVERAMSRRVSAGPACRNRRTAAIDPDPAAIAARRLGTRRVQLIDMTRLFCASRFCLPVIGGALVHHDTTHFTGAFSATLGEPLLRRLRPLAESWSSSMRRVRAVDAIDAP